MVSIKQWCCRYCNVVLTEENQYASDKKWQSHLCIGCHKEHTRIWEKKNPQKHYLNIKRWRKKYPEKVKKQWARGNKCKYERVKEYLHELKINGCAICGYDKYTDILEFHHVEPKEMAFHLSVLGIRDNKNNVIAEEIAKCVLLCPTCHREIHFRAKTESNPSSS